MMNMVPERPATQSEWSSSISRSCGRRPGSSLTPGDGPSGTFAGSCDAQGRPSVCRAAVIAYAGTGGPPDTAGGTRGLSPDRGQPRHGHLDAGPHSVDGARQGADLVRAARLSDGRLEVAAADLVRRPGQASDGPGQPLSQEE